MLLRKMLASLFTTLLSLGGLTILSSPFALLIDRAGSRPSAWT